MGRRSLTWKQFQAQGAIQKKEMSERDKKEQSGDKSEQSIERVKGFVGGDEHRCKLAMAKKMTAINSLG